MTRRHLSITRIVIFILVVVTTVVLSVFAIFSYYQERKIRLSELRSELMVQSGQLSNSLTLPMWNFDSEQIDKIIESTMQNRNVFGIVVKGADQTNIVSACVRDAQGRISFSKSEIQTKGLFVDRANIILSGKNIGTVSVFVTPRLVEEYLRNFLLFIVVSIIALNICLVFVIFQLLSRTVIKPLKAIESYALKVGAGDHEEALIQGDRFFGELENLRCSILLMTQSLSEAQQELIRKEKLSVIGQLSGIVAHEIRNPLGVMNNAVYLLNTLMPNADDNVKKYLDMIKHEIDNSQRIVSDLLDFARTKTPQISPIAPGTLVTQSLGKSHIPENVSVKTNISETLPELLVDPFQMGQVLRNLFTNAIQAMPGGGTLTIATQRVSSSGLEPSSLQSATCNLQQDFVEILVKDTGEGITPENMKKLFQPLFTTKAKGVGLGLLVCENLVKANGGRIEVKSTVGIGTTFTIKFPISERI